MKYYDDWGQKINMIRTTIGTMRVRKLLKHLLNIKKTKMLKFMMLDVVQLVGVELKKFGYHNFYGADLSKNF